MEAQTRAMVFFQIAALVAALSIHYASYTTATFMGLQAIYWAALAAKRDH